MNFGCTLLLAARDGRRIYGRFFLPAQSIETSLCLAWPRSTRIVRIAHRPRRFSGRFIADFCHALPGIKATYQRLSQQHGYSKAAPQACRYS
eukprot:2808434-Pleurochrysis_carterae.AAC.1